MKKRVFGTVVPLAAAVLLAVTTGTPAQDKCQEFRALSQLWFDGAAGGYVGPTFARLADEVLVDRGDPRPPVRPPDTACQGSVCTDRDAQYLFDFGNGDTLTLEVKLAVYDQPPVFGNYRGTNRVASGTGRFRNASGIVHESGPFFAWVDGNGQLQSRYSGEMNGRLCGVAPK